MINSDQPLVSIGIPTYNRADGNLRKVIERALGQTYANVEVIVSDNCSSDHTSELVGSIEDSRLHYFRQDTNIGPNKNFNFCLNQAKGKYFLLFHDDDMIDVDFVESCMSALQPGQAVGAVFTGVRIIDQDDNVLKEHQNKGAALSPLEFVLGWFESKTVLYLCSTLYNTEKLKEVGGLGSKKDLYDDLVPTFKLASKYGRVDVREVKASFRRHLGSRGSSIPIQDWIEDSLYLLNVLYELFPGSRSVLSLEGRMYFCKKMYGYAPGGAAVSQSFVDLLRIYRAYNYCYSPLDFWYKNRIRPKLRSFKKILFAN